MLAQLATWPLWALIAGYVGAWFVVAVLVRTVLKRSLDRLARAHKTALDEVLAASIPRPAGIAVFLLAMSASVRWLPLQEAASANVRRLSPIGLGALAVVTLMRMTLRSIEAYGRSNPDVASSAGIARGATWMIGLAGLALFVSDAVGISLAPALTALGVGSLAFALALQDTLSNFFAGLYLLADKPVRPGDFIRIEATHSGYVQSIGWRSTHLRTLANNLVIVPNATLSKAVITNFNRPEPHVATEVRVDVASDSDSDKVEAVVADELLGARDIDGVLPDPAPFVRLSPGFADGALAFTVYCRVISFTEEGRVQHELRKRIFRRLRREGIALPKPRT